MELATDGLEVLAAMAAPAVLLLGNAMLILSTNQRLQNVLDRVRETELAIIGSDAVPEISDLNLLNDLLLAHAKRAKYAHRALLSFYVSAVFFMSMVVLIGLTALGVIGPVAPAIVAAFAGCVLFALGAALLVAEAWLGIRALDRRFANISEVCRRLAERDSS
jgi:small-conductance mechanosensitive channel